MITNTEYMSDPARAERTVRRFMDITLRELKRMQTRDYIGYIANKLVMFGSIVGFVNVCLELYSFDVRLTPLCPGRQTDSSGRPPRTLISARLPDHPAPRFRTKAARKGHTARRGNGLPPRLNWRSNNGSRFGRYCMSLPPRFPHSRIPSSGFYPSRPGCGSRSFP